MGKLHAFDIVFDPVQGVFSAGSVVTGYVTLEVKETLRMRGEGSHTGHIHNHRSRTRGMGNTLF